MKFPLAQFWLAEPDPRFQPGEVEISRQPGGLIFLARLTDHSIVSRSTAHNQPLHLLGDTLEIFLQTENAPFYWELHISPHNHRTLLRWPVGAIEQVRRGIGEIDDYRLDGNDFQSSVTTSETGWEIQVIIPRTLFPGEENFRFSVSRYDHTVGLPHPIHSSTSPHPVLNFHRLEDWRQFPCD